jgi:hypothetical protein
LSDVLVTIRPEGDYWWVVDVPDYGVTQAEDLTDVEPMVRDLIATMTGEPCTADVYLRLA